MTTMQAWAGRDSFEVARDEMYYAFMNERGLDEDQVWSAREDAEWLDLLERLKRLYRVQE